MKISPVSQNCNLNFNGRVIAEHMPKAERNSSEFNSLMQSLSERYAKDDSFDKVIIDKEAGEEIYTYAQVGDRVKALDYRDDKPLTTKQENYKITVYNKIGKTNSSGFYLNLSEKTRNGWFQDFCNTIDYVKGKIQK